MQWRFDENRADFRPALSGEIEADPDALYIIQRGDVLMVREGGHEWPMPERLDVAGQMFDREQFEGSGHPLSLRAEMERDGQWARAQLQARDIERAMLERCLQIATTPGDTPQDQAEANVCRLAGMIVDGRYPEAGKRLSDAATAYFADHPEQQVASAEVVRRGWVINAPRLRDRLERMLEIAAVPVYEHEDQA